MPRSTVDTSNVAFLLEFNGSAYGSENYAPAYVRTVTMNSDRTNTEGWPGAELEGLQVKTYGLSEYLNSAFKDYTVRWFKDDMRLAEMEAAVKTLRKIESGMEKIDRDYGQAGSFGAYVQRVAKVLGIQYIGFFPPTGQSTLTSGNRIRFVPASEAAYMIDYELQQWVDSKRDS